VSASVTAIVLAGGRSRRFGSDKLAVEIDGMTVLDRAIVAVSALATEVLLVGEATTGQPIRRIVDPEPFGGPLQAVSGALDAVGTDVALVVAGDMPSLVPDVLKLLVDVLAATTAHAVILADPRDPLRRQPLPLAVQVEPARTAAATALESGDRSLVRLLDRLHLVAVPVDQWQPLDPEARTLVDIDVPDDIR
jgi:molybdopterin-guanine dinucleotide biosynthesis protein A